MTVLHSQEGQNLQVLSDRVCIKLPSTASPNKMAVMTVEVTIEPDDFVHVPVGTIHGYRNDGDRPVRFLAWSVGGAIDEFFTEMSEEIREMPNDLPKMPAILAKYGVQMVQPAVAG